MTDPDEDEDEAPTGRRGERREAEAAADDAGKRLDAWLAGLWPDLSRSRIQGLIGAGKLEGGKAASEKVQAGRRYVLELPPPEPAAPEPEDIPLRIAFEDEHLIVIDKPAGMTVHPAAGALTGTLVNALLAHCRGSLSGVGGVARPGIVHRIDKDTTGLIVAAKSDAAHAGLAKQFARHTIERVYYAVTRGAPRPRSGAVEARIARSMEDRRKMAVVRDPRSEAGRHAVTRYWTIESYGQIAGGAVGQAAAALVECRLETGRTHQIRVHLAHIGAPLIGDSVYGKFRGLKAAGSGAAHAAAEDAARAFPRQALHAAVLGFAHPVTGATHRFESPLPDDLTALLTALRAL